MTNEEHAELVEIVTGEPWHIRTRLRAFLEKYPIQEVKTQPEAPQLVPALSVQASPSPSNENFTGHGQEYPEYEGPPTF